MSDETGPKTKIELQNALDRVVQTAYENGVEINNSAYALRHDNPKIPDWEIHLTWTTKTVKHDD
ncbi:hypothetical protein [Halorubrum sp. AJ67]|uniref:hypothetical protein n=1 Tax=Halorubrum sp. AJ67 TaxID=1173487 RepID=UPI0012ABC27C|nr:hypothetical protein [Halorubrum sp. AJ67]